MYRALARIPGVRVQRNLKDFAGRTGIGVVFDGGGDRGVIILNPRTYA